MTAEEKLLKIQTALANVHPYGMTENELAIWEILYDKTASADDKKQAASNTEILEFA